MDNTGLGDKLKIATLNCNGLRNIKHRRAIFHYFKKNKFDIIALQESYLLQGDRTQISSEWGNSFHLSEGTKISKGLLTLFGERIDNSNLNICFSSDRVIISSLLINQKPLYLMNIYAPCQDKDKIEFFKDLSQILTNLNLTNDSYLVVLGDANTVMNNSKDIISGLPHANRTVKELNFFVDENDLIDIWRIQNSDSREYTYSKKIIQTQLL